MRGYAEADIHRIAPAQLLRHPPRDDLADAEFGQLERGQRPEDFARDRRLISGVRGLHLVRRDHDRVHENAGDKDLLRPQGAGLRQPLDLRDDNAAIVAHRERLIERAEIGALMLIGEVAALVGRGGADDCHIGDDRREEQPFVAREFHHRRDGRGGGLGVHRAAFPARIDEGVHADLGQHARPFGGGLAMHVEQDAGGDVVGRDAVAGDHLPNFRRLGLRRPRWIGPGEHARQAPVLGQMVDALDAPHIASGDRVQRRQIARTAACIEASPDCREHSVRASQTRGRRHRDDGAVGDEFGRLGG